MKKTLITLTSLILICILTIGCTTADANINTSKELNKNLDILSNTVSRLDTIDNAYLVNNELYSLNNTLNTNPTPHYSIKRVLANSNSVIIEDDIEGENINLQESLTQALTDELINRLYCDENGNCKLCNNTFVCDDDGVCNSCNQTIICDENGNCNSCKTTLNLDENNNCSNCQSSCTSTANNLSQDKIDCLKRISAQNNDNIEIDFLSLENDVDNNNNDVTDNNLLDNDIISNNSSDIDNDDTMQNFDENNEEISDTNYSLNSDLSNYDNEYVLNDENNDESQLTVDEDESTITDNTNSTDSNTDTNTNTNQYGEYQLFYYSEEGTIPDFIKYRPRFVNTINYNNANGNLSRYLDKLQKLYTMTADVVEANNTLGDYKVTILTNIDEAKELNNCILSGDCVPSNSQRQALTNYISDIRNTINNLKNCNGNLTNEINKISSNNTGLSQSLDVTNSNYLRILNQIDTRISYHENALATLEQIKFLLEDAQNNSNSDTTVEDLNNSIVVDDTFEDSTDNLLDNDVSDDINNSELDNQENNDVITDTNSDIDNEDLIIDIPQYDTNTGLTDGEYDNENEIVDNTTDDLDNEQVDSNSIEDFNSAELSDNDIDESNNNQDNLNDDNIIDNDYDDTQNTTDDEIVDVENSFSNIDTYANNDSNLDLDKENAIVGDTENIDNTNITNSEEKPQMVDSDVANNANNDILTNNNANGIINNNNTNYPNSIINENNLNKNNIGNNSYRYDSDGNLYNNTNGYENNNINNVNTNNNNVNTYKYNTLIDSINRGTIDNGINNLNIA